MVRNPWGVTNYAGDFKHDDAKWTDSVVANVPLGIDPRTSSAAKGIFILPKEAFKDCFEEFSIAHTRSGFSDNWYDALDMDDEWHTYFFTMPAKSGDFYVTVESYYENVVPKKCASGTDTDGSTVSNPTTRQALYKAGATAQTFAQMGETKYYQDQGHDPFMVKEADYAAGDVFAVYVKYDWWGSPAPDYTVKVYSTQTIEVLDEAEQTRQFHTDGQSPSEFTESTYCGMTNGCTPTTPYDAADYPKTAAKADTASWFVKKGAAQIRRLRMYILGGTSVSECTSASDCTDENDVCVWFQWEQYPDQPSKACASPLACGVKDTEVFN